MAPCLNRKSVVVLEGDSWLENDWNQASTYLGREYKFEAL